MAEISFEDWQKLELKVGKITQAEKIPETDKLYKLVVDIGTDKPIQLVSGLREYYSAEELLNKQIIVLCNLRPAKFAGVESQGMLLVAEKDSQVILLSPEKEIAPGSQIS